MAGHSPQAKCLCEILVQKGIRVNHTDVAWHSPEVMLEDVEGQVAERFWLKISYPQMRMVFAGFTQIVPNPISFVLCMGSGRCTKSKSLPVLLDGETSKIGSSHGPWG